MKYYQYPNPLVVDGHTFLWANINNYTYPNISLLEQIGGFIHALGVKMKAKYGADGTNGKTYSSTLLSDVPRPVIEGPFAGMYYLRSTDNGFVESEVRWCFKECDDRAEILEKYEKWLSEQEK